jgi:hypothetical protein
MWSTREPGSGWCRCVRAGRGVRCTVGYCDLFAIQPIPAPAASLEAAAVVSESRPIADLVFVLDEPNLDQ